MADLLWRLLESLVVILD